MIACCTGLHLARGAAVRHHKCPASPVSGVHVSCLTDSPALARFRRAPMPRRSSWSSKARRRLAGCFIANVPNRSTNLALPVPHLLCVGCFGHTRSIHTNQDSSGLGRSRVRHVFQFQDFGIAEFAYADHPHREVMLSSPNVHL